jgi:hypothetical protein
MGAVAGYGFAEKYIVFEASLKLKERTLFQPILAF